MDAESPQAVLAQKRLGTVLCGKYTVDRLLGVGGMAVVYAATHRNQKRVAIKMLHAELSVHPEIRKRFLREGYVANSVKHRGAVDVIDDDVAEDGAAFLVMELLEGLPVDELAAQHADMLDVPVVLAIGWALCDVLEEAHSVGIVHRDIKPANLFVTRDGEVKVLDFGIARLRDPGSIHATNPGMLLGTPAYMGPEQALARTDEIGPMTDVWAVAATMFNLLTGTTVHIGASAPELLVRAATDRARSILTVMPDLAPPVAQLIDKALTFERLERGTVVELRDAILAAYEGLYGPLSVGAVIAPLTGGTARDSRTVVSTPVLQKLPTPAAVTQIDHIDTAAPVSQSYVPPRPNRWKFIGGAVLFVAVAFGAFRVFEMLGTARDGDRDADHAKANAALVPPPSSAAALPSASAAPVAEPAHTVDAPRAIVSAATAPQTVTVAQQRQAIRPVVPVAPPPSAAPPPPPSAVAPPPKIDPGSVR